MMMTRPAGGHCQVTLRFRGASLSLTRSAGRRRAYPLQDDHRGEVARGVRRFQSPAICTDSVPGQGNMAILIGYPGRHGPVAPSLQGRGYNGTPAPFGEDVQPASTGSKKTMIRKAKHPLSSSLLSPAPGRYLTDLSVNLSSVDGAGGAYRSQGRLISCCNQLNSTSQIYCCWCSSSG